MHASRPASLLYIFSYLTIFILFTPYSSLIFVLDVFFSLLHTLASSFDFPSHSTLWSRFSIWCNDHGKIKMNWSDHIFGLPDHMLKKVWLARAAFSVPNSSINFFTFKIICPFIFFYYIFLLLGLTKFCEILKLWLGHIDGDIAQEWWA